MPDPKSPPVGDELYEKYLKMQDGEGQNMVDNWVLPNNDERFDDEAKAEAFEARAADYADTIFNALKNIKHKK